jgi:AraC family transcriptional regulator
MANDTERRILRVLEHIHADPSGDLSLDALADVAAMSRFHWHRVYRAVTGETAAQTVRRMRMHRAAVLLLSGGRPVAAVATSVGYPDTSSFTRAFREAYGMSPTAFRARGHLQTFPPTSRQGESMMHPVTIRTEPARRLAAMPHRGPYTQIAAAFQKLGATLVTRGLHDARSLMIAVYYDDPSATPETDLRSDAGVEVGPDQPIAAPLEEVLLPAGRHAVLTFSGPYAGLPAAYDQLYGIWLPESGETPADSPVFEIYRNTPMDTAPEDLITEICVPLQ